ncbi:cupin domain-containing protein [Nonomuraea phyllanthi]|uniref:Cupin domain-containing protein n=1 Tax=Nonomuraea phyllanthi TaxID=2219224 RepID=A0A5C4W6Y1_9ACTN|nr:XRE family transcriptional regulator [Nonomuraea phyllanthi]KAB8192170.1 cupin domain-containing protein [Nonomuraea phyllanthi]QFY11477.1 cupin domain-containing protein [Nonomuraea phyllanthi]
MKSKTDKGTRAVEPPDSRFAGSLTAIGSQLRQARLDAGLSLRELAARSGLSSSFLSLVERGECSLSLTSLFAISEALGLAPAALLGAELGAPPPRQEFSVWRGADQAEHRVVVGEREYFPLRPGFEGQQLESLYFRIHPTAVMAPPAVHEGEEVAYVTSGELFIRLRNHDLTLAAGDAIHFPSSVPHTIANRTAGVTEVMWVMTHPSPNAHPALL